MRQRIKEVNMTSLKDEKNRSKIESLCRKWQNYYYLLSSLALTEQTLELSPELKERLNIAHFAKVALSKESSPAELKAMDQTINELMAHLRARALKGEYIPVHELMYALNFIRLLQKLAVIRT